MVPPSRNPHSDAESSAGVEAGSADHGALAVVSDSRRELLAVFLKGLFMGAADTVPGVSGGTIALVTGIYERLITAITAIDPRDLRHILGVHTGEGRRRLVAVADRTDVVFLVVLGTGMITAVVTLARVLEAAVEVYPGVLGAFFFGLIAASAVVLYGTVDLTTAPRVVLAVVGIAVAWLLGGITAGSVSHAPPVVFLAGAVAICAMVLPGVSGAFLLLLLGQYEFMVETLNGFVDALVAAPTGGSLRAVVEPGGVVVLFVGGAVVGLLTMAHAVRWALDNYREATLTLLVSLMVGGLRVPAERVHDHATLSVESLVPVVLAALVGGVGVLAFDHYTDDLEYD